VKFEKWSAETTDPLEQERCARALADVDLAALATLHGFASRLLNEFAIAAGLPPRVRVLDEVSSQLAHEDRWERFVDGLYADPANAEVLLRAALVGIDFEPQYQGHATLKDVAVELNGNWDRLSGVADLPLPALHPPDFTAFDDAVTAVCALPGDCTDGEDLFYRHLVERLIPEMTGIVEIDDPYRKLARIADAGRSPWTGGRGGKAGAWNGDAKAAKAVVGAVNDAVEAVIARTADDVLRPLLVLVCREVLAAAEARRADGGLEFHDLLVLARDL
jgi:ATP-dependent helicase/nuclease subunit A